MLGAFSFQIPGKKMAITDERLCFALTKLIYKSSSGNIKESSGSESKQ